jgi:hypothetical protein
MTNKNKVQSDLIKSKYEKINKILAHIEQKPFLLDYSNAESEEQNNSLTFIKGYN